MDKFYVGAKHIGSNIAQHGHSNSYTVETVEEAIEQAKDTIRKSHGSVECLVVVKIVAIVRREVPITVETVE